MSDFYNEKIVKKSRKDHKCDICRDTISSGSSYKRINALFEGNVSTTKVCERCIPVLSKFFKNRYDTIGSEGYTYDDVAEDVTETIRYDCKDYDECIAECITCEWAIKKYLEVEE